MRAAAAPGRGRRGRVPRGRVAAGAEVAILGAAGAGDGAPRQRRGSQGPAQAGARILPAVGE